MRPVVPHLREVFFFSLSVQVFLGIGIVAASRFEEESRLQGEEIAHVEIDHDSGVYSGAPAVGVPRPEEVLVERAVGGVEPYPYADVE